MNALTHNQNCAKRLPGPMSEADTRSTERNHRQLSANSERLDDHVDTGLNQIMNMRVGCWQPPMLANVAR
jgi:hypothetical protein